MLNSPFECLLEIGHKLGLVLLLLIVQIRVEARKLDLDQVLDEALLHRLVFTGSLLANRHRLQPRLNLVLLDQLRCLPIDTHTELVLPAQRHISLRRLPVDLLSARKGRPLALHRPIVWIIVAVEELLVLDEAKTLAVHRPEVADDWSPPRVHLAD